MELQYENASERGLRNYLRLVAEALHLPGEAYCVQLDPSVDAYLALEQRLPAFPDRDAALVWNQTHGWALAVEAQCGEDLIVCSYLGGEVVPEPRVVARFARLSCDGAALGDLEPPTENSATPGEITQRLSAYLTPAYSTGSDHGRREESGGVFEVS